MKTTDTLNLLFLQEALARIIDDHKKRGEHGVDITQTDLYHTIGLKEALNPYDTPSDPLPMGSVDDDLSELKKLMLDEERLATPMDMERVANLLRVAAALLEQDRS
ncbi:hypothetical protein [Roseobacter weihaiensis]|uniref:hypothetical protein n=1 Tax=Roseobacter weihaiensis TaxID=2763262 RepID=UPI001D0B49BD|nr:hypothetical protein [Roseobacter sp. H9]